MQQLNPLAVRKLRIFLPNNDTIDETMLTKLAGNDLMQYMIAQPGFPEQDLTEEDGLHWNCRKLATWMSDHPKLFDLYVQGKALTNPSGRTCEINQGYKPGRI